jgi:hypothetical protein
MPKNILSFELSSGGFSGAEFTGGTDDDSEAVEAAVEVAGEASKVEEPEDAEAMTIYVQDEEVAVKVG